MARRAEVTIQADFEDDASRDADRAFDHIQRELDEVRRRSLATEQAFDAQRRELESLRSKYDQVTERVRLLGAENRRLKEGLEQQRLLFGTLGSAVAGYLSVQTLRQVQAYSDSWINVNNRLRLATSSHLEFQQAQAGVFRIAQNTRSELEATATLYNRLQRATLDLTVTQQQLLAFTELTNKAIRISGANPQEAQAALLQFGQGLGSGRLGGEELRSIQEQAQFLGQVIAQGLGVGFGELRRLGAEGELTTERIFRAVLSQTNNVEQAFAEVQRTAGEANVTIGNSFVKFVGLLSEATGATSTYTGAVDALRLSLDLLSELLADEDFKTNLGLVTPTITGAAIGAGAGAFLGPAGALGGARMGAIIGGSAGGAYTALQQTIIPAASQSPLLMYLLASSFGSPQLGFNTALRLGVGNPPPPAGPPQGALFHKGADYEIIPDSRSERLRFASYRLQLQGLRADEAYRQSIGRGPEAFNVPIDRAAQTFDEQGAAADLRVMEQLAREREGLAQRSADAEIRVLRDKGQEREALEAENLERLRRQGVEHFNERLKAQATGDQELIEATKYRQEVEEGLLDVENDLRLVAFDNAQTKKDEIQRIRDEVRQRQILISNLNQSIQLLGRFSPELASVTGDIANAVLQLQSGNPVGAALSAANAAVTVFDHMADLFGNSGPSAHERYILKIREEVDYLAQAQAAHEGLIGSLDSLTRRQLEYQKTLLEEDLRDAFQRGIKDGSLTGDVIGGLRVAPPSDHPYSLILQQIEAINRTLSGNAPINTFQGALEEFRFQQQLRPDADIEQLIRMAFAEIATFSFPANGPATFTPLVELTRSQDRTLQLLLADSQRHFEASRQFYSTVAPDSIRESANLERFAARLAAQEAFRRAGDDVFEQQRVFQELTATLSHIDEQQAARERLAREQGVVVTPTGAGTGTGQGGGTSGTSDPFAFGAGSITASDPAKILAEDLVVLPDPADFLLLYDALFQDVDAALVPTLEQHRLSIQAHSLHLVTTDFVGLPSTDSWARLYQAALLPRIAGGPGIGVIGDQLAQHQANVQAHTLQLVTTDFLSLPSTDSWARLYQAALLPRMAGGSGIGVIGDQLAQHQTNVRAHTLQLVTTDFLTLPSTDSWARLYQATLLPRMAGGSGIGVIGDQLAQHQANVQAHTLQLVTTDFLTLPSSDSWARLYQSMLLPRIAGGPGIGVIGDQLAQHRTNVQAHTLALQTSDFLTLPVQNEWATKYSQELLGRIAGGPGSGKFGEVLLQHLANVRAHTLHLQVSDFLSLPTAEDFAQLYAEQLVLDAGEIFSLGSKLNLGIWDVIDSSSAAVQQALGLNSPFLTLDAGEIFRVGSKLNLNTWDVIDQQSDAVQRAYGARAPIASLDWYDIFAKGQKLELKFEDMFTLDPSGFHARIVEEVKKAFKTGELR